ncbi:MAG: TIGR01212 family radical SAM protein [Spirochaetales bacterium]|uniref:TIGR01212 family radical SAM protein n=1 Tax=Candidatus Thalassospirochaeta sargassi TaxID=3119039 RepID=A0AAJ1IH34_9SPIO|nr:TIGR01212 family radical SAM protein [Spirochaetales bacterium]
MINEPFYSYGSYLKKKYGVPAFRVGIDAGFSCPNRKSGRESSGCTYCDAFGARAMYQRTEGALSDDVDVNLKKDIVCQTEKAAGFLKKRYKAEIFLLYFQAFSSTYGSTEHLKAVYDYALSLQDYSELIVSTRPDCLDREKVELLADYKKQGLDVWVELGLQSSNDATLKRVNRGHSVADFEKSYKLLQDYGIKTAVHLIFGLPGEGETEIMQTCRYTAGLNPEGVKFHNLHIPYNTPLYQDFLKGKADAPTTEEYLEWVIKAIQMMPESTVIMRLTCDSREDERAAPKDFVKKTEFYNLLRTEMLKREVFQGRLKDNNLL